MLCPCMHCIRLELTRSGASVHFLEIFYNDTTNNENDSQNNPLSTLQKFNILCAPWPLISNSRTCHARHTLYHTAKNLPRHPCKPWHFLHPSSMVCGISKISLSLDYLTSNRILRLLQASTSSILDAKIFMMVMDVLEGHMM